MPNDHWVPHLAPGVHCPLARVRDVSLQSISLLSLQTLFMTGLGPTGNIFSNMVAAKPTSVRGLKRPRYSPTQTLCELDDDDLSSSPVPHCSARAKRARQCVSSTKKPVAQTAKAELTLYTV